MATPNRVQFPLYIEVVRLPGFEPGLRAWEARVLTARLQPRRQKRKGGGSNLRACRYIVPLKERHEIIHDVFGCFQLLPSRSLLGQNPNERIEFARRHAH